MKGPIFIALALSVLPMLSITAQAQETKTLVTLAYLDETTTLVQLQEAGGKCRFFGELVQKSAGDFEIKLERQACPDEAGADALKDASGKIWIGLMPELPSCKGSARCKHGIPLGSSLSAEF